MNENHRDLISISFTIGIVLLAGFVAHNFIAPLAWAAIIAIASWPVYKWLEKTLGQRRVVVATILTTLVTLVVALPLFWLTIIVIKEARILIHFLMEANAKGIPAPNWLQELPKTGAYLTDQWNHSIGTPKGVAKLLADGHVSIKTMSDFLKMVGLQVANRSVIFSFAIICLFFFYRDGELLSKQVHAVGKYCLQDRWQLYANQLPGAVTATVNGVILVGIAVGIIMGIIYAAFGVPLPTLFGALTAVFAMIPFAVPVVFLIASFILIVKGSFILAFVLGLIGTLVMFIADHFVRPVLIGGVIRLHFLAVLFGILGGVETMGVVGLFIGPVIMVLFATLWQEPEFSSNLRKE